MRIEERIINNGHGYLDASYLVIHETANPGATAPNHVAYWRNNPGVPMTHYVCDWDPIVYHCVPDNCMCWHVGNGNAFTIGIELCHAETPDGFLRVWYNAVEFAAYYLNKRGWGIDRLLSHDDCRRRWGGTDHTDPISYFEQYGRSWQQFKDEVSLELELIRMNSKDLARDIVDELMNRDIKNFDSDFHADVKWRVANLGNKTQGMLGLLERIAKKLDEICELLKKKQ